MEEFEPLRARLGSAICDFIQHAVSLKTAIANQQCIFSCNVFRDFYAISRKFAVVWQVLHARFPPYSKPLIAVVAFTPSLCFWR